VYDVLPCNKLWECVLGWVHATCTGTKLSSFLLCQTNSNINMVIGTGMIREPYRMDIRQCSVSMIQPNICAARPEIWPNTGTSYQKGR
jgi:hypothetical protein